MVIDSMSRLTVGSVFLALAIIAPGQVFAQSHAAGCFIAPAKAGDDVIGAFLGAPAEMVTVYPSGGFEMVSRVRALAGSSADVLDPMIGLVPQFNATQKAALGTGLARVARACAASTPEYAQTIQEKVAAANSPEVTTAFLSALNEVQTAALGAGAGGGAGGAAAGVGGGAAGDSSGGLGGDSSTAQTAGDFTTGSRSRRLVTNITNITNEVNGTSPF